MNFSVFFNSSILSIDFHVLSVSSYVGIFLEPDNPEQKHDPINDIVIQIMYIYGENILAVVMQMDKKQYKS
jgi:hypothetical protein